MKRRTKIVCTLGPAVDSRQAIKDLIAAGMNVARINCSHGGWEQREQWIRWVRELSPEVSPIAVLVDLSGPKTRIGPLAEPVAVTPGQRVTLLPPGVANGDLVSASTEDGATLCVPDPQLYRAMEPGDRLLFGDGDVQARLIEKTDEGITGKVLSGGLIKSKTGITLSGKSFGVKAITSKDEEDLARAAALGADIVALSYVRSPADVQALKHLVAKHDKEIRVCAKIETKEALREIDEIVKVSDVVMVARGDLGLQLDLEEVPVAQKRVIRKCNQAGVPVITATQMLESMMNLARPTRAEATDVANAILDGTDAVMLSGETAAGKFPIEACRIMNRIADHAEEMLDHHLKLDDIRYSRNQLQVTEAVAHSAVRLSEQLAVKAIVTTTTSGTSPRMVSKFRPRAPILCVCWRERTQRAMAVVWGVEAALGEPKENMDEVARHVFDLFIRCKRLKVNDPVVLASGFPTGTAGNTNLVIVESVR